MIIKPDFWVLLKIIHEGITFFKLFSSWKGGYLDGDSWRISSAIVEINKLEGEYKVITTSGSIYTLFDSSSGTTSYTQSILNNIINDAKALNYDIEVIEELEEAICYLKK